ncbi:hypothetical protein ACQJBY_054525 [Aegilops geniculata]
MTFSLPPRAIASAGSACITSTSHCQPPCAAPSSFLRARLHLNFPHPRFLPTSRRPDVPYVGGVHLPQPRTSPASGAPARRRVDAVTTASRHSDRAMASEIDHGRGQSAHPFLPCSFLSFLAVLTCCCFDTTS